MTLEDLGAQFGQELKEMQLGSYGCGGVLECTFKFDGNCVCFNTVLHNVIARAVAKGNSHDT